MHSPDTRQPSFEPLDPIAFWQRYSAQIEEEIRALVADASDAETFDQALFERVVKGERQFAEQVLGEAQRMQQETGVKESLVLFDVDETIAATGFAEDNTIATVLRPAATPVFATLKSAGLQIGFFTSRTREPLQEEIKSGSMKTLQPYVTPAHTYTREYEKEASKRSFDSHQFNNHIFELCGGPEGILDEEFVKKSAAFHEGWWTMGAMTRLQLLKKLRNEFKGPFLMVDDLEYPQIFNGHNGVYGVGLDDTSKFFGVR